MNKMNFTFLPVGKICSVIVTIIIFSQTLHGSISVSSEPSSNGESDGKVIVIASGDAGPFEIILFDNCNESTRQESNRAPNKLSGRYTFEDLTAGAYSVIVIDKYDCETCTGIVVDEIPLECPSSIHLRLKQNVTSCNGCGKDDDSCSDDGLLEITIEPLEGDYVVTWESDKGGVYSGLHLEDLPEGRYTVTVTGENCSLSETFVIAACEWEVPSGDPESADCMTENINNSTVSSLDEVIQRNIYTGGDGYLEAVVLNKTRVTSYHWETEDGVFLSDDLFLENLDAGTYCFVFNSGCQAPEIQCETLYNCALNPIVIEREGCTDFRYNDNRLLRHLRVNYNVSGGEPPYSEEWATVTEKFSDRTLYVTDARGCQESFVFKHEEVLFDIETNVTRFLRYGNQTSGRADFLINSPGEPFKISFNGTNEQVIPNSGVPQEIRIPDIGELSTPILIATQRVPYTIEDVNGCRYEDFLLIENCDDIRNFWVSIGALNEGTCDDSHSFQILQSVGDLGPFEIKLELIESYGDIGIPWNKEFYFEELPTDGMNLSELPSGKFEISFRDFCSGTTSSSATQAGVDKNWDVQYVIETCPSCHIIEETKGTGVLDGNIQEIFRGNGPLSGLHIEIYDKCNSGDGGRLKIDINEEQINSEFLPARIDWGNGEFSVISLVNGDIEVTEGPSSLEEIPPGIYTFSILRGDGCSANFEYEFRSDESPVVAFGAYPQSINHLYWEQTYSDPWESAYAFSFICSGCNDEFDDYIDMSDCTSRDGFRQRTVFNMYLPDDPSDPCDGGGVFRTFLKNDDGTITLHYDVEVPPNKSIREVLDATRKMHYYPEPGEGLATCDIMDLCLFNSVDLIGVELDKPLMLIHCKSSQSWEAFNDHLNELDATISSTGDCGFLCSSDEYCNNGECYQLCPDGDCPAGYYCNGGGVCIPTCDPEFNDCPNGQTCGEDGRCIDMCESVICDPGYICENGQCVPDSDTACENVNCSSKEICVNGDCELSLCEFMHSLINGPKENYTSDLLYFDMPESGTYVFQLTYCTGTTPDRIRLIQNGVQIWEQSCGENNGTGSCSDSGGNQNVSIPLTNDSPVRIQIITNCNNYVTPNGNTWSIYVEGCSNSNSVGGIGKSQAKNGKEDIFIR